LGSDHWLRYIAFKPDRTIQENAARYREVADDERAGATIWHPSAKDGTTCLSYIGLNAAVNTQAACWSVDSWDPLTLSPSLLCTRCGDHGFIRGGKWVPA